MPKCFACPRVQSQNVSLSISGKCQSGICGQHACPRAAWTQFMSPADLACLIVDCLKDPFAPKSIVCAGPAIVAVGQFSEVKAVARMSVDKKQACLRVEAGGTIVRHSALIRGDQSAIRLRFLVGIRNGASFLVDS